MKKEPKGLPIIGLAKGKWKYSDDKIADAFGGV